MPAKSELELFLESQSTQGEVDSEGRFTISRLEALKKIAQFQLPFESAWAVKLVQAIVASKNAQIKVELGATSLSYSFQQFGFEPEELATAYFNPEPSGNPCLRHLVLALWSVGLANKCGFQIAFPHQEYSLVWDGSDLKRLESRTPKEWASITIAPLREKGTLSWMAGLAKAGSRNADLLLTLREYCCVCPVPLLVDGRRIDALQKCPNQGWSTSSFPLSVGGLEPPLPCFRLPPGTYDEQASRADTVSLLTITGGGWQQVADFNMKSLAKVLEAPLAYVFSVHMKPPNNSKTGEWEMGQGPSMAYWVLDGAIVGREELIEKKFYCSIGCFISAQGLETDLSTFSIVQSPEKERRLTIAYGAVAQALSRLENLNLDSIVGRGNLIHRAGGSLLVLSGMALLSFIAPLGVMTMAVGSVFFLNLGDKKKRWVTAFRESIRGLREALFRQASRRLGRTYP